MTTDTAIAVCPRCAKRPVRRVIDGVEVPGAVSRADNQTEVCSLCGTDEALVQFFTKAAAQPVSEWPVKTPWGDSMECGVIWPVE